MSKYLETFSEEALLRAWNEWKEICHVDGCDTENKKILRTLILGRMNKVLQAWQLKENLDYVTIQEDFLSEFDLYLSHEIPRVKSEINGREYKDHKDHIWSLLTASDDPPLRIINGKLLGKTGKIMDVTKKFLRKYCDAYQAPIIDEDTNEKVIRMILHQSGDKPLDDNGQGVTHQDMVADYLPLPDEMAMVSQQEMKITSQKLIKNLTKQEMILLLAQLQRLSLADDDVCQAIGKKKSTVYELADKLEAKLISWYQNSEDIPQNLSVLFHATLCQEIIGRLNAETTPEIKIFLNKIAELE